jgi:copper resistance protein D
MTPRPPRLSSPAKKDLPEEVYAAQKRAFEMGSLSTDSFVPGQSGTRPNTPAEKAWSEYNHHWAGIIVLSVGFSRFLRKPGESPGWATGRCFFWAFPVFFFWEATPDVWPLGPNGFWVTFADPEVLLHRIFAALVAALAVFEWRVQTGRVASANIRLMFPMLIAVSGALLLTHSHSLGNVKEEVLAELSHIPLAILAVMAGWSRWLELRLPAGESHARLVDAALAGTYLADRHSLVELPRNVVGRDLVEEGKNLTHGSLVPGPGLEPGYSAPKADVLPIRRSRRR